MHEFISHSFRHWKFEIKVPAGSSFGEYSQLGYRLLSCCILAWWEGKGSFWGFIYKGTNPIFKKAVSSLFNYLPKTPPLSNILSFNRWILGEHKYQCIGLVVFLGARQRLTFISLSSTPGQVRLAFWVVTASIKRFTDIYSAYLRQETVKGANSRQFPYLERSSSRGSFLKKERLRRISFHWAIWSAMYMLRT